MDSSQDFKSLYDKIQAAVVATTRSSNQIAAEDLSFQRHSNPAVDEQLDETSERFLTLASSLLKSSAQGTALKAPNLEDADDVDVHWSRIVDVVDDALLDKANICLDEYTGLVKRKAAPTEEAPKPKKTKTFGALDQSMRRANILKPQNAFQLKPNNFDNTPWKPTMTSKPHALIPLKDSLGTFNNVEGTVQYDYAQYLPCLAHKFQKDHAADKGSKKSKKEEKQKQKLDDKKRKTSTKWRIMASTWDANGKFRHKHPYETEILKQQFPEEVYEKKEPIKYQPVETTAAVFVDTFQGVLDMIRELKEAKEIAIDTEHHDFRTYTGLLSLMQISTRDKDWIVDTLQPWRHKLEVLNEVFADPNIVKVLHGAYMDIIWLQRDCGLYIVGLFDTYEASVSLGYSGKSLAYLLKRFVDFDADKKFQLADWRIRPIPDEMYYYARSDTHYLLYIYDMMRNELLERSNRDDPEQDLIGQVLERSKETSLRRYERPVYDAEGGQGSFGWYNLLLKQSSGNLSREQFAVFRAVHKWRDELARREDESPLYILSNPAIFDISRSMPSDSKALSSILRGFKSTIPRRAVDELLHVIGKAKLNGANGPTVSEFIQSTTGSSGIGAVAQQVFPHLKAENLGSAIDTDELVSQTSRLWGGMPVSTKWESSPAPKRATDGMQFALPWASFVENATVSENAPIADTTPSQPAAKTEQDVDMEDDDGEFTLKAGRKRKAPGPESEGQSEEEEESGAASTTEPKSAAPPGDEIMVDSSEQEEANKKKLKKAKKAERKMQKKAAKLEKGGNTTGEGEAAVNAEEQDEEPFDYSKANSVLKGPSKGGAEGKGGNGKKAFNPYASTLMADGPKPARRMHGEKPGKSATFKKL